MKIGLLTYYGDLNCGTNLQAYALLTHLCSLFPADGVEIVPLHGFNPPGRHPYLHQCTFRTLCNDVVRMRKYKSFVKSNLGVVKDHVIKDVDKALRFINDRNYDAIFVGADTLLELDRIHDNNNLSLYWLSPKVKAKKFMVAASVKNVEYASLTPMQKEKMSMTLSDFSGYAVRDSTSITLLENFIPQSSIDLLPDPTFGLNVDYRYVEAYMSDRKLNIPSKSILFHTNKEDLWVESEIERLKSDGYKIYSFRPVSWADEVLNDMSPLEQLGIYRYFDCVVTHRFHDAVFCLKNQTPMLLYSPHGFSVGQNGSSKFSDLLNMFGLYETNFLCTYENLSLKVNDAKNAFVSKRMVIDSEIRRLLEKYNSYLEYCRNVLLK